MENKKNIYEECKYETTCNIDGLEDECCFEERYLGGSVEDEVSIQIYLYE